MSAPMTPRRTVEGWAAQRLAGFLSAQGAAELAVTAERPRQPGHGDFALNLAMQLAGRLHRPPLQVAEDMAALLLPGGPVGAVEVAPPGFINLRLDHAWLVRRLEDVVIAGADWGRADTGAGVRVQVEFVSANPTGPLLFSHGRGAVVGDSVARLLAFTGYEVEREFYVNDAGRQVLLFADSLLAARRGESPPEDGYVGAYIQEIAGELPEAILAGAPDDVRRAVADWGIALYLERDRRELEELGIVFDSWFSERRLYGAWETETLDQVRAAGAITEHDGATWLRFPDGKEDVLFKSTGESTYFLGDLLYHRDKLVRRGFDIAINVWGSDHQNQVRRLKDAVAYFGVAPDRLVILLIQLVRMKSAGEFVRISRRAGNLVLLSDLLEEVGPDAVRYHYLLRGADAPMDFDVDLAREQSNENPVFYAQYAHARLCSVEAVAAESGLEPASVALERLTAPAEVDLVREVMEFPDLVEEAARRMQPHLLPHYAQRLAEKIHAFYHAGTKDPAQRVLGTDPELSGARLYLCLAARQTMANALGLMGVTAPNRM
ncbi:MAG: arginine--tRNA ligase [Candidatus Dormibacteraeota bacterium]|nr:arginine--tRNA ligase [Candidatus Dormibacteraeota bacterium]